MASDSDDDYVCFGTRLQDQEESGAGQKIWADAPADPGAVRALPVHQQEVTDAEGRRRFHGAFTGGYSAGYFNTVGSKVRTLL